ncbi:hypothetical protein BH20BAC1_BH20BAC1_08330 [soil metagenome]
MKIIPTSCILFLCVAGSSQNVTIDYEAWNPANPPCKLWVNPTDVPATGTTTGNIVHQTLYGQPFYDPSDLSVQMGTEYQATGSVTKGARYRIDYNFKAGYTYTWYHFYLRIPWRQMALPLHIFQPVCSERCCLIIEFPSRCQYLFGY